MKLVNRQIVEIYKYKNERERDAHFESMIREGWKVETNPLLKRGLLMKYTKKEEVR